MSQANILIVEDEVIVAENLSRKLANLGYAVVGMAVSGNEAIEMVLELRPQLVLMDIKIQGDLDGIETFEKIKKHQDIPVIYLTAHSDRNTLARAKASQPNGYVLKPFDERDLATQIELALYKHEADRKVREQREWLRVTLASIGDAVIATNAEGAITYLNPVAEALTGWPADEAIGKPLTDVFRIINEYTRTPVDDPVHKVLQTGAIVGLANHTVLICRDGKEVSIDDSGAPIKDEVGRILGVVLTFRDISVSKQAEKAIYESEQRLRLFIEHAPASLAMFDRQMRYLSASRRWQMDFNLDDRDLTGLSHYEVLPEIPERWKAVHSRTLSGEVVMARNDRFERADGSVQWLHWEARPWRDQAGNIGGIVVFTEDVTELKRSEEESQVALLRQNQAVRAGKVGLWDWDLVANTANYSAEWKKQIGYEDHEIGNDFDEWERRVHPDDLESTKAVIQQGISEGRQDLATQFRFRHKDGSWRWILAQASIIKDESGKPIRMMGSHIDMTEQIKAQEKLQESQKRYRTLFEHIADGIFLHDLDGNIVDVNRSAAVQSGYSRDELRRMSVFDLIPAPSNKEDIIRQWRQFQPDEPVITEDIHQRRDGSTYPVEVNAGRVYFDGEDMMLAIVRDISKRKQTEKERETLQEQLTQAQKMESVGRLAGGVAHDFNNMLGVIIGHTELAVDQVKPTSPAHGDLIEIRKAAQRSADLTRQLLAFARQQTSSPQVIDLNKRIGKMQSMIRRLIGEDIHLAFVPEENLHPVRIDPSQVDQILANLCVNSRDAIKGIGKIVIETQNVVLDDEYCAHHAGCTAGNYVMLAVSDNGCGIEKQNFKNLFEPFYTTKKIGEGTGLGLSTVYGIVKQNSGYIEVYSEPGQGATFKIYFPQSMKGCDRKVIHDSREIAGGNETVLLVEDEGAILNLAKVVLQRYGYNVLAASAPNDALTLVQNYKEPIHLVITDVVMPEMNGWELKKALQKLIPEMKVLFMSGYTANIVADRGVLEKDVEFLQKPFSVGSLARKVREVLDRA